MGELLLVILPALVLAAVLWAVTAALTPRGAGISDAELYQLELASQSAAHDAEQVRVATAARARIDAMTRPSQNEQQQTQQLDNARLAGQTRLLRRAERPDHNTTKNYVDRQQ